MLVKLIAFICWTSVILAPWIVIAFESLSFRDPEVIMAFGIWMLAGTVSGVMVLGQDQAEEGEG